jgi:hypothetical protein
VIHKREERKEKNETRDEKEKSGDELSVGNLRGLA